MSIVGLTSPGSRLETARTEAGTTKGNELQATPDMDSNKHDNRGFCSGEKTYFIYFVRYSQSAYLSFKMQVVRASLGFWMLMLGSSANSQLWFKHW